MKAWVDGAVVEPDQARVSVFDHGLTVGDGVFETAKVVDGVPFALTRHLRAAGGVGPRARAAPPPDDGLLRDAVAATLAANADVRADPLRLRITLTGGTGPLGSDRGDGGPTLVVALAPMRRLGADGRRSSSCRGPATSEPRPPGSKTTSYADNVVALAHAKAHGGTEALLANTAGDALRGHRLQRLPRARRRAGDAAAVRPAAWPA